MSVSICDVGEGAVVPAWVANLAGEDILIDEDTVEWIKVSKYLFYSWHYYGNYPFTAQGRFFFSASTLK